MTIVLWKVLQKTLFSIGLTIFNWKVPQNIDDLGWLDYENLRENLSIYSKCFAIMHPSENMEVPI